MEAEVMDSVGANDNFIEILKSRFAFGIRINSPIEIMRFKRFYSDDYGMDCPWTDEEIMDKIQQNCFIHEEKGYILEEDTVGLIMNEIYELKMNGARIVYYSALFEKNEEWFYKVQIFSETMLKNFIKKYASDIFCKKTYFSWENSTENILLTENIIDVWGTDVLQDYYSLEEKMEYVPIEKIKYALANNVCFVWNSAETYTLDSRFVISDSEKDLILRYVDKKSKNINGVSLEDIPAQSVYEENFELSKAAILTLIFEIVLSHKYERCNRIVTLKGQQSDAAKMLQEYCLSKDKISLSELLEQWQLKTGTHRQAEPLEIAYSVLTRVDMNTFVRDEKVKYNVSEVDKALETIVVDDAVGMKEIVSFALFPHCNYPWNLFLLESFCRKKSKTFKYMAITPNSRNAGAIVRRECKFDYHTLLANMLAKRQIELEEKVIMNYLYENGFVARRSYKYIHELIELSKELREGR
jgi:hypothetical protein